MFPQYLEFLQRFLIHPRHHQYRGIQISCTIAGTTGVIAICSTGMAWWNEFGLGTNILANFPGNDSSIQVTIVNMLVSLITALESLAVGLDCFI